LPPWDEDGGYTYDYSKVRQLELMGSDELGTFQDYMARRGAVPPFKADYMYSSGNAGNRAPVALVLVNSGLYSSIQTNLNIYVGDLEDDGYQVEVYQTTGGDDEDLKDFILNHSTNLAGCVLVGDHAVAWYDYNGDQFPCDLYFMELDGTWTDSNGDGVWDGLSAGSGDQGPEIYIGHIDASMMNGNEVALTNDYFVKNHAYRQNLIPLPDYALSYTEDDWVSYMDIRTDIKYAYPNFDDIPGPATNRDDYVDNRVPNPAYEFIQLCCHSSQFAHYFTRGGLAYNTEIKAAVPHAMFYNLFCCSTLRFTEPDFLGGAYIYNSSDTSVAVIGSTKSGSMLVFAAFYQPFSQHETFGESFRQWFNYLAPYSGSEISWHFGMTIAGDPFLAKKSSPLVMSVEGELPSGYLPPGPETKLTIEIKDGTQNYVPGSGMLHYRFDPNDVYDAVGLTSLGNDLYEAVLPNTRPGDEPEFYFSAEGDGGATIYSPYDAPNNVYSFGLGFTETVFADDFESDLGWVVQSENITTGEWERGDPSGTDAQPEDDHSAGGTMCYVTGKDGGSVGDHDVDGGPTRLRSPAFDLSRSGEAVVSFYLWFYHTDYGGQQPLELQITNTGGGPWTKVEDITHSPSWVYRTIKVSDYVAPTSDVMIRLVVSDNPNDDIVEALLDDFEAATMDFDPTLWADAYSIPVSVGSVIDFTLGAGPANANRPYMLLGSVSGTSPGVPLPGGAVLPIKWDILTHIILSSLGSPVFANFTGNLDAEGEAVATLDTYGPLDPALAGITVYFAYMLAPSPFYASNFVPVTLDP